MIETQLERNREMAMTMGEAELNGLAKKTDAARKRVMELRAQLAAAEADLKEVADAFNERVLGASPEKEKHSSTMNVVCPVCHEVHGAWAQFCENCGSWISSTPTTYVREAVYEEHYVANIPDAIPEDEREAYVLESLDILNSDPTTTRFLEYNEASRFE